MFTTLTLFWSYEAPHGCGQDNAWESLIAAKAFKHAQVLHGRAAHAVVYDTMKVDNAR
jgi:hypothetical protein